MASQAFHPDNGDPECESVSDVHITTAPASAIESTKREETSMVDSPGNAKVEETRDFLLKLYQKGLISGDKYDLLAVNDNGDVVDLKGEPLKQLYATPPETLAKLELTVRLLHLDSLFLCTGCGKGLIPDKVYDSLRTRDQTAPPEILALFNVIAGLTTFDSISQSCGERQDGLGQGPAPSTL